MATAVRPDRAGSVGDYLDWKRQAEDMAWFVASVDGEDAGCALAYVGWHSAPGTGTGEAFVLPEHRGAGVGSELYRELAGWVQERGCVTLETTVSEDDEASLAWADRRGFREIGRTSRLVLDLTAIDAPAVDPPEGVEIVTWAERPDLTRAIYEVACEAYPDEPGSEGNLDGSVRDLALEGHARRQRPPRSDVHRARRTARSPGTRSCRSRARARTSSCTT